MYFLLEIVELTLIPESVIGHDNKIQVEVSCDLNGYNGIEIEITVESDDRVNVKDTVFCSDGRQLVSFNNISCNKVYNLSAYWIASTNIPKKCIIQEKMDFHSPCTGNIHDPFS